MEPYDFEAVQVANEFYALVEKNKDDIVELEGLRHEILQNEVLKSYRKKESEKKENEETMRDLTILFIVVAILFLIALALSNS